MFKFLDNFIPDNLAQRVEDLFRGRVFVLYVLLYMMLFVLVTLILAISPDRSLHAFRVSLALTIPVCLFFAILLFLLRGTGQLVLSSRILLLFSFALSLFGVAITGGPSSSPGNHLLILPIIMSVCLLGAKEGALWSLVAIFVYALMLLWQHKGGSYHQIMEQRHLATNATFAWFATMGFGLLIFCIFEQSNRILQQEREIYHERVKHLAAHDELTGIANRRTFEVMLNNTIERNSRYKSRFALFYIDLDAFKAINDHHGHAVGDEVLRTAAQRLSGHLRDMDFVARLGGDEFAVIADNIVLTEEAEAMSNKIRSLFDQPVDTAAGAISVGVSLGYNIYPDDTENSDDLWAKADEAMYRDKRLRKSQS